MHIYWCFSWRFCRVWNPFRYVFQRMQRPFLHIRVFQPVSLTHVVYTATSTFDLFFLGPGGRGVRRSYGNARSCCARSVCTDLTKRIDARLLPTPASTNQQVTQLFSCPNGILIWAVKPIKRFWHWLYIYGSFETLSSPPPPSQPPTLSLVWEFKMLLTGQELG